MTQSARTSRPSSALDRLVSPVGVVAGPHRAAAPRGRRRVCTEASLLRYGAAGAA